jgi:molybdopterin converting factor small subunit
VRVTVQLFARLRDVTGLSELGLDVPAPAAIRDVWSALVGRHPGLEPYAASLSCARNLEYARFTTPVEDGDEIAFLPPVSGG